MSGQLVWTPSGRTSVGLRARKIVPTKSFLFLFSFQYNRVLIRDLARNLARSGQISCDGKRQSDNQPPAHKAPPQQWPRCRRRGSRRRTATQKIVRASSSTSSAPRPPRAPRTFCHGAEALCMMSIFAGYAEFLTNSYSPEIFGGLARGTRVGRPLPSMRPPLTRVARPSRAPQRRRPTGSSQCAPLTPAVKRCASCTLLLGRPTLLVAVVGSEPSSACSECSMLRIPPPAVAFARRRKAVDWAVDEAGQVQGLAASAVAESRGWRVH